MNSLVTGVWLFILFSLSSVWVADILPHPNFFVLSLSGSLSLFLYHCVVLLLSVTFYLAIVTPPGSVPYGWSPPNSTQKELDLAIEEAKRRVTNKSHFSTSHVRYCPKCKQFKPTRTFHCSECDRCILRMDHHCPWINNCVGVQNHKYFFQFVVYAAIGCSWTLVLHFVSVYEIVQNAVRVEVIHADFTFEILARIVLVMDTVFLMPVTLGLLCLSVWQIRLAITNVTSVEHREMDWEKKRVGDKAVYVWKYDFGCIQNLNQFLGPTIFDWFFPTPPPLTSGWDYKTSPLWTPPPPPTASADKACQSVTIQIDSDDDYESRKVGSSKAK